MSYIMREENDGGVYEAKKGTYAGHKFIFTHRDPKTGLIFAEDLKQGELFGKWLNPDKVKLER